MNTITSLEQVQGIVDALYYANQISPEPIEEEKNFYVSVSEYSIGQFVVKLSYIAKFIESKYESDEHLADIFTQEIYVNEGASVYKLVKDILVEIDTIYKALLPELFTEKEIKEWN